MKHHIVAIGVSQHRNSTHNLTYAAKDAAEFFDLFTKNLGDIGYSKLLTDNEATLGAIQTALGQELMASLEQDDAFFFYYSGHGANEADPKNTTTAISYLIPYDASYDLANSAVPITFVQDAFSKIKSKINVICVDACFSGAVGNNSKSFPIPNKKSLGYKQIKTFANTPIGNGTVIFTACKEDETAIEDPEFQNGLFTYYLLDELQKDRAQKLFPLVDIFNPLSTNVQARAKDKYQHTQTPTMNGKIIGNLQLPVFQQKIKIVPDRVELPKSTETSPSNFYAPVFELDDKQQEKTLNELSQLVSSYDEKNPKLASTFFEKNCSKLMASIKKGWEDIFSKSTTVQQIPDALAELEAKSYQFMILGAVVAAFGNDRQMQIYTQTAFELLELTRNRSGLIALIDVPEMILVETVYIVGMVCVARKNLRPWQVMLNEKIYDFSRGDTPPTPLKADFHIYYSDAVGGYATKVNDHVRAILKQLTWLPSVAPKIEGKVEDYQLQVNFLLTILMDIQQQHMWPDFGRFYAARVFPIIQWIKYDADFSKQVAELLEVKQDQVRATIQKSLSDVRKRGLDGSFFGTLLKERTY